MTRTGARVMVVDDDAAMCRSLLTGLRESGFDPVAFESPLRAFEVLRESDVDVVLTDLNMRELSGIELCTRIVADRPDVPVLVLTAFGSMESAIAAIRAGAYDFITKPVDIDAVAIALDRALQHRRLREEVRRLRTEVAGRHAEGLAGESPPMVEVRQLVRRFADSAATVLVTGESGTGKEVVARMLHTESSRSGGPFVAVSCAAIPETLIESELFGHARGAFTDARHERRGLMVQATGGTLFLDEIGEMPLSTQAKLLRALQERAVRPVGREREVPFDARIVVATHRDLEELVEEGLFREDLFFRIHVLHVALPPLRARGTDVLLLAQHFVTQMAARAERPVRGITPAAASALLAYPWPGNVRELQNAIEHAVAVARYEEIAPEDLPARVRSERGRHEEVVPAGEGGADGDELVPLEDVERAYVTRVLAQVSGNKRMAARILGLDRKTLYRKLERWGLRGAGEAEG